MNKRKMNVEEKKSEYEIYIDNYKITFCLDSSGIIVTINDQLNFKHYNGTLDYEDKQISSFSVDDLKDIILDNMHEKKKITIKIPTISLSYNFNKIVKKIQINLTTSEFESINLLKTIVLDLKNKLAELHMKALGIYKESDMIHNNNYNLGIKDFHRFMMKYSIQYVREFEKRTELNFEIFVRKLFPNFGSARYGDCASITNYIATKGYQKIDINIHQGTYIYVKSDCTFIRDDGPYETHKTLPVFDGKYYNAICALYMLDIAKVRYS